MSIIPTTLLTVVNLVSMAHHYYAYSFRPACFFITASCPPCSSYTPSLTSLLSFLSSGAEVAGLPGPFSPDWHATVLCRLVGHPE